MNCVNCNIKSCRSLSACKAQYFDSDYITSKYLIEETQKIVQVSSDLVDGGRAGLLSRLDELIEYILHMEYKRVGLAYCYGMEAEAGVLQSILRRKKIKTVISVSCTVGGLPQASTNTKSCIHHVACNPIGQAEQLNLEKVDFTIAMGLCLGHDVLFNKYIESYVTTYIVKDRLYNHAPIKALKNN